MLGRKETKISDFISQMLVCIQKFCSLVNDYHVGMLSSTSAMEDFEMLRDKFDEQ